MNNKTSFHRNNKELRYFGLLTGIIVAILFGLVLPRVFTHSIPMWPWIVAIILSSSALLSPALLRPIYKGWMTIGGALGWINTRIILGILYYALFLPIGLFMRLLGKDPMARKINRNEEISYRIPSHSKNKEQMKEPY